MTIIKLKYRKDYEAKILNTYVEEIEAILKQDRLAGMPVQIQGVMRKAQDARDQGQITTEDAEDFYDYALKILRDTTRAIKDSNA